MLLARLSLWAYPAAPPLAPHLLSLLPLVVGVATVSTTTEVHRFIISCFCKGKFFDSCSKLRFLSCLMVYKVKSNRRGVVRPHCRCPPLANPEYAACKSVLVHCCVYTNSSCCNKRHKEGHEPFPKSQPFPFRSLPVSYQCFSSTAPISFANSDINRSAASILWNVP